jgi:glycosyltransferase involved in cell wall biosynthesis
MAYKESVSVIVTSYNRKEWIGRALDSIITQARPPDEIILVDDGSSDDTDQFIKEKYPDIKYIWQKNRGISNARNTGISLATGNWISFLDSDDEWLSTKLENQLNALRSEPEYKICYTNEIWIRKGRRVNPMKKHEKSGGFIFKNCLPLCIISPSSVIIHRSVFDQYGLFDESLPVCEDYDLWLRLCAFLPVFYIEKQLIIKYGGHHDQLSGKYWGMDRFRISALEKIIENPALSSEYKNEAIQILYQKINIYISGAKKRGKKKDVEIYEGKKAKYEQMLNVRM